MKIDSENVKQIYRRRPMRKYDFNKVAYFGMGVLLYICCIFSEQLFQSAKRNQDILQMSKRYLKRKSESHLHKTS